MRSAPLYRLHWEYRQLWRVSVPPGGSESMGFAYVEGVIEGRLEGQFRGTNHARMRSDGRFLPDVQGVIETAGGTIVVDYQGYGCPYPRTSQPRDDRTRVVVTARHWTDDPAWEFLNDSISIGIGENRFTDDGVRLLYLDVEEVLWEPLAGRSTQRPPVFEPVTIERGFFDLASIEATRRLAAEAP